LLKREGKGKRKHFSGHIIFKEAHDNKRCLIKILAVKIISSLQKFSLNLIKNNNAFTIQSRIVLKKKCRKSTYQEAIQQHEPLRHQQLLEPRGHKQQEHNCEQDGEKPPGM
jgi:hypothetical protein